MRLPTLIVAALIALAFTGGWAAKPVAAAPASPVSLPFDLDADGHVLVPIQVNGFAGLAILDNGAQRTAIDRTFAEKIGLARGPAKPTQPGQFELARRAAFKVSSAEDVLTPILLDMRTRDARHLIATLGLDFFERHVVELNFTEKRLTLHDRAAFTPPAGVTALALTISAKTGEAYIPASIEGQAGHLLSFDLGGASHAIIGAGPMTDRLLADGRLVAGAQMGNLGIVHDTKITSLKSLSFAGFTLTDIPTDVLDYFFAAELDVALGAKALALFDLYFDIAGRRMWMRPNSAYGAPFERGLIGKVSFVPGETPGTLRVQSVQPDSPASRAGLKVGDILVRVQGRPATPSTFEDLGDPKEGDVVTFELQDGRKIQIKAQRFY